MLIQHTLPPRTCYSLEEYVPIGSRQLAVEVFGRHESGWSYVPANEPTDSRALTIVGVRIALSELHARIMDKI